MTDAPQIIQRLLLEGRCMELEVEKFTASLLAEAKEKNSCAFKHKKRRG